MDCDCPLDSPPRHTFTSRRGAADSDLATSAVLIPHGWLASQTRVGIIWEENFDPGKNET